MEPKNDNVKEIVLSYIRALDSHDYTDAETFFDKTARVKGPSGEEFNSPHEFMGMLQKYAGKYEVKKVFVDGDDVCLLYNFTAGSANALMCSWYQLQKGKITSIQTIFDPSTFSRVAAGKPPGSD
jgi:hypothetical protein